MTCGYIVDWIRTCYESDWKLFANSDTLTRGAYYWADPEAPHFPFPHWFGSKDWTTDERVPDPQLGEFAPSPRPYSKGGFPIPKPLPVQLGSDRCISNGETFPLPPIDRFFIFGVDSRCWPTPPPYRFGEADGGSLLGGAAQFNDERVIDPFGGVLIDGTAEFAGQGVIPVTGGVLIGDTAKFVGSSIIDPLGGGLIGGAAEYVASSIMAPLGGTLVGGAAQFQGDVIFSSDGGVMVNGTATFTPAATLIGSGGVLVDGTPALYGVVRLTPSDGVSIDGAATFTPKSTIYGTGGALIDGAATIV